MVYKFFPRFNAQDIKKAFRRKAMKMHLDKVPHEQRKQATKAFRELNDAYDQATVQSSNEFSDTFTTSSSKPSRKKKAATDSKIKKTFDDVCEELKREKDERSRERFQNCLREVRAAWPDKEQCWEVAHPALLSFEIDELIETLKASNPELACFFIKRKAQHHRDFHAEVAEEISMRVKRVKKYWPEHKDKLKQWVKSREVFFSEWDEIAERVENPNAAQSIRLWLKESRDEIKLEKAEKIKASAKEIVEVFPDRKKILPILDKHVSWEWQEIYDLLPNDVCAVLCGQVVAPPPYNGP